jgi:hypothetical protein
MVFLGSIAKQHKKTMVFLGSIAKHYKKQWFS